MLAVGVPLHSQGMQQFEFEVETEDDETHIAIVDNAVGDTVGTLSLQESPWLDGAWQFYSTMVEEEYQGFGLGQSMLLLAVQLLDIIHPDWSTSLSLAAARAWSSIEQYQTPAGLGTTKVFPFHYPERLPGFYGETRDYYGENLLECAEHNSTCYEKYFLDLFSYGDIVEPLEDEAVLTIESGASPVVILNAASLLVLG